MAILVSAPRSCISIRYSKCIWPTLSIGRNDRILVDLNFIGGLRFGNNDASGAPPHGTGIKVIADDTFGAAQDAFLEW